MDKGFEGFEGYEGFGPSASSILLHSSFFSPVVERSRNHHFVCTEFVLAQGSVGMQFCNSVIL